MQKSFYVTPRIELLDVLVERGFVNTGDYTISAPDYNDNPDETVDD